RLGHPERRFPSIHVAGTNGKGSTCAMLASCLGQRYRVGFYSSPHLVRVNERFRVDGRPIDDATLALRIEDLRARLGEAHGLTYFEFGTVLAFWHFAEEAVDVAVVETGLGGRLDATSTCAPCVTAITSIDFDHVEYLGSTLPAIALEKAGIVKGGVPLVVARPTPEVLAVFERVTRARGSPLVVEGRDVAFHAGTFRGERGSVSGLSLPLRGLHQEQNAGVALACLERLREQLPLTDDELRRGLAHTRWPGRLEEVDGDPTLLLDGAHNPAGAEVLAQALERSYAGRPLHLVFGVFADKDAEPMMRRVFPLAARVVLTPLHSPRSKDPASYVGLAERLCQRVAVAATVPRALAEAIAGAERGAVVVVAGSLHLVGEALASLEADFEALVERLARFEPLDDVEATARALDAALASGRPAFDPPRFRAAALSLLERFPDAELGAPGPLVHALERMTVPDDELAASLARQPTFPTVSMVNRAMNLTDDSARLARLRALLEGAAAHPRSADWVRTAADRYLAHQAAR
ncbi:MAG: bifunctional folylpolyglutamate synthase/dihydrofolate synthase, partial [Myxococcaceae bacterium]|nr:bifunctional folylpolyglutamate synthase/dihydrofolate synthase [Myxococcaceae bacterium]